MDNLHKVMHQPCPVAVWFFFLFSSMCLRATEDEETEDETSELVHTPVLRFPTDASLTLIPVKTITGITTVLPFYRDYQLTMVG